MRATRGAIRRRSVGRYWVHSVPPLLQRVRKRGPFVSPQAATAEFCTLFVSASGSFPISAAIVAAVGLCAACLKLLLTVADSERNYGEVTFRGRFPQGGSEE